MNKIKITNSEKNYLFKNLIKQFITFCIIFNIPFLILYGLEFDHLYEILFFRTLRYVIILSWIYFFLLGIIKTIFLYMTILKKKVKKIEDEFIVIEKKNRAETFESSSYSTYWYYLELFSHQELKKITLEVSEEDYKSIKNNDIIKLIYFNYFDKLIKSYWNNVELSNAKIIIKNEYNLFRIFR